MKDINEFFASKCNVYVTEGLNNVAPSWLFYDTEGNCITILDRWDITDPRCRELCRERFKISTTWDNFHKVYLCFCSELLDSYHGETIAEAECRALQAIFDKEAV